jgi:hypothetical protein
MMQRLAIIVVAIALLSNCDRPASSSERGAVRRSETTRTGAIIDSALPPGESMRRFRVGLDSPAHFDGPSSRDALVQRFFAALRRGDRAALRMLAMNRAEFAYLVFPRSRWSKPPYNQPPDIEWLLLSNNSESGLTRLTRRAGNFTLLSYTCRQPAEMDGPVKFWPGCLVRLRENGQVREMKLFGSIMELDGRFKLRDFNNDF